MILIITAFSATVSADQTRTLSRAEAEKLDGSIWMSGIADDTELSKLNIPGTENSGMKVVSSAYQGNTVYPSETTEPAQEGTVLEQLSMGVRILQIGLTAEGDDVWDPAGEKYEGKALYVCVGAGSYLFYGMNDQDTEKTDDDTVLTFSELIADSVMKFLDDNKDETVILLLRPEGSTQDETIKRLNDFFAGLAGRVNSEILYTENGAYQYEKLPALSACRGKIVILSGFADADGKNTLDYGMLCDPEKDELFSKTDEGFVLSEKLKTADAKNLWLSNFPVYYEVKFSTGNGSKVASQSVKDGSTAAKPSDPTRADYSFDGWYTDEACKNAYDFSKPITDNLTLYAKWVQNRVVRFYLNYSSSQLTPQQVKPGSVATEPETPVRDGYTFDGWYKEKECQNKYDFSTPVNQDLNLYAAWTCTFTFEPNGGTMSVPLQQEIRTGNRATEPSAPKKTGLTFAGWYSNSSLTLPYNFTTTVTKATTVYAKWTALVTFGSNGGTGTMNPVTVNEGQQYSLPTCYFTPPRGHKFDGWDLGPAGTKIEITGPVSLQAQWKEVGGNSTSYTGNYNVTFYTNGGSSIPSQSIPYGQAVTRPADPVRQGYEFDNWYTDGTYSTVYDFQSPVTTSLTLYARWLSSEYYTISFDANGGSGWMESVRVDRGSSYVLPGCNFTAPAGKRFVRWNFGPAGESMNVNSDMILVAQWGAVQDETPAVIYHYTVRFDTGGGSEVPEQTVESGNCAVRPENPTRRGFIFDGWYSDIARKVPYDFLEEVSSDMTLYCGWISGVLTGEISYRITNGEDQQYEKGSDKNVIIVVKRSWDDDSCYTHFTNVVLDNRVLSRYRDYTAASGSTIITFDRSFLDGTENGLHTVRIVFNDGSVETTLRIGGEDQETTTSTEPQSHEEDSPVTGDPSAEDMPMWVSLLVLSACAAICLMIVLYMKKAAAKQAEKKGGKNEF
ncbi:MAG: InlB B-repeat-containing protein [Lachnospiraceae bacterium]|nr:InlB B-repeat-containing protein [Lachnospiraceae bacterium]